MAFWKKMHELKKIKTLRESIEKIKTLVAELKITTNFKEVNNTFFPVISLNY